MWVKSLSDGARLVYLTEDEADLLDTLLSRVTFEDTKEVEFEERLSHGLEGGHA